MDLFKKIKETSSSNEKLKLLEEGINDLHAEILRSTYNDDKYGINTKTMMKVFNIDSLNGYEDIGDWVERNKINGSNRLYTFNDDNIKNLIIEIKKLSGNNLIEYLKQAFKAINDNDLVWLSRMLLKDLKIGMNVKSINKVFKKKGYELISEFVVQLCTSLKLDDEKELFKITYPCYCEIKYDGCLFKNSKIQTDNGLLNIEDIVNKKLKVNVLSYNKKENKFEYKPIINWYNNGLSKNSDWVQIYIDNGNYLKCTKNHVIFTNNGCKEVKDLDINKDKILSNELSNKQISILFGFILGDGSISFDKKNCKCLKSYRIINSSKYLKNIEFKSEILNYNISKRLILSKGYNDNKIIYSLNTKSLQKTIFPIDEFYDTKLKKRKLIEYSTFKKYFTNETLSIWYSDDGCILYNNGNKETPLLILATHRYSKEQIQIFVKMFNEMYNVNPSIYKDKRVKSNGEFLRFNTKDSLKLYTILKNYLIKETEYKYYYKSSYIKKSEYKPVFKNFIFKKFTYRIKNNYKYDIEVKDNHNYVSDNILVHNSRTIARVSKDNIQLLSRAGKDTTKQFPEIVKYLKENIYIEKYNKYGIDYIEFDGEIISSDFFSLQKRLGRKEENINEDKSLKYMVFDIKKIVHINRRSFDDSALITRKKFLMENFDLDIAEHEKCYSIEEVKEFYEQTVNDGHEGIIIKNIYLEYAQTSKDCRKGQWKLKPNNTIDLKIVGAEYGTGKYANLISVLHLENKDGSIKCSSGSGLKDWNREEFTKMYKENSLNGRIVEIKYWELQPEVDGIRSLRFPIFVALRDDKMEAD